MCPVVLFQDNKSTISMLANGRLSSARMRCVNTRYFFLKDHIETPSCTSRPRT